MSLFNYASNMLFESSTADLLDPEVDSDVKEVIEELEDDLTTNVKEVPASDKESNGATELLKPTKESCMLYEAGNGKYFCNIFDIMRICEAEEEETGVTPDAGEVAADVADANGKGEDDLVIVAPLDTAKELIEACINEAKCGKKGSKAKSKKKAKSLSKALKEIKDKGIKVATLKK